MSEPEKQPEPVAPETAPVAAAPSDAPAPGAPAPAAPAAPAGKGGDRKQDKKRGGGGGGGGAPKRRVLEAMPALDNEFKATGTKIRELDAEIADELEAAMGGSSAKDLFGAETSRQVRGSQSAPGEGGARKKGRIVSIHGQDVFVHVPGGRSEGVLPMLQFTEGPPKVGDEVEVSIEGYDPANGLLMLSRQWAAVAADWSSITEGMIVEARVLETNKGGLSVDVNGIRGFMPISQIDLYRVENTTPFVNQKLTCIVTEANPHEKNLVVSRRALLEKQRVEIEAKMWAELEVGQVRNGTVRSVKDFGAFVDLGGVDGFLHVSEISWRRVQSATAVLQSGQPVRVAILKLDPEAKRISLGLKQLEASPWDGVEERLPIGAIVAGRVTRTADFGAFVELEPGLEGLIHVSELSSKRIWRVSDIAKEGQDVQVKIMGIDLENRRISLSMRQAFVQEKPKAAEEEEAEPETPAAPPKPARPRNFELRGGVGGAGKLLIEGFGDKK